MREAEKKSRSLAKDLRGRMTNAEVILWSHLRMWRYRGITFRRQHPIGPYVADFACTKAKLVLEIDGETHGGDKAVAHDRRRDAFMQAQGWRVIRITNDDVYRNLDFVLNMLAEQAPPPPRIRSAPPP